MGYLGRLLGLEGKKALQLVSDQIANHDPTTASLAQLQEMEADLDKAGRLIARLRQDATREEHEAVEAKRVFDLNVSAAERLQAQLRAPDATPERKQALTVSLNSLITSITNYKTSWDREQSEADDAHSILVEAEEAYTTKATALKAAKETLTGAKRELERSQIHKEQATQRAELAAQVAGLREDTVGGLNGAVNSLQRITNANNQAAEAARMKANALRKPLAGSSDDPLIRDALTAAANPALDDARSLDERLAALTGRAPTLQLSAPPS